MFDIKAIRENPEICDAGWARRGLEPQSAQILEIDARRRRLQTDLQGAQARRNDLSKEIGKAKAAGKDAEKQIAEVGALKSQIQTWEAEEREAAAALNVILEGLPNLPSSDTPDGADESANVVRREEGENPAFDFEPREHFDLGEGLGQMDFERAARISGARFVVLTGGLARLERALGQFMLDVHTREFGYTEVSTPVLVRSETLYGTGQLPKFADDLFKMGDDHWLIPTAEVPLSNLDRESIIAEEDLPKRIVALTQCFRAEAGAAGRDTRGMIRQHQFAKVEMVSVTAPEESEAELDRMTGAAEEILKRLGLAYRVVELCAGDLSFSSSRTYDLEVWLPGQGRYREISSCSTCGDFQARRMQMRCRKKDEKETRFPHTLNGSGLAVGRTLVAVMENYQQADGSIRVPEALTPYMGGLETIDSAAS